MCCALQRSAFRVLAGTPEGKRPVRIIRHRWDGNTKMDLKEIRCKGVSWTFLDEDRVQWRARMNLAMHLCVL
jgi:hypothetical protein